MESIKTDCECIIVRAVMMIVILLSSAVPLCLGSLQSITPASNVVLHRACRPPRASAGSSVIEELEGRLRRRLSHAEIRLAHEAVDETLDALETRLSAYPAPTDSVPIDTPIEEIAGAAISDGAALAAASWGSWRVRAPTHAKARAHHILIDDESKALSLLKQLAFGADFRQLAAEHSLCPSKDNGGDLGSFAPGDMAQEFDAFIFDEKTPTDTPLGPVKTPFGYHVVIIDERML